MSVSTSVLRQLIRKMVPGKLIPLVTRIAWLMDGKRGLVRNHKLQSEADTSDDLTLDEVDRMVNLTIFTQGKYKRFVGGKATSGASHLLHWSLLNDAVERRDLGEKDAHREIAKLFGSRNLQFFEGLGDADSETLSDLLFIWQCKISHFRGNAFDADSSPNRFFSIMEKGTWVDRVAFQTMLNQVILQRSDGALTSALAQIDYSFLKSVPVRLVTALILAVDNSGVPNKSQKIEFIAEQQRGNPEFQIRMLDLVPKSFPPSCVSWSEVLKKLTAEAPSSFAREGVQEFCGHSLSIVRGRVDLLDLRHSSSKKEELQQYILNSLIDGVGCSLIRLGDGEAFAYLNKTGEHQSDVETELKERHWWGKALTKANREDVRRKLRDAVIGADILGIPSGYRLARDLPVSLARTSGRGAFDDLLDVIRGVGNQAEELQASLIVEDRVHQYAFNRDWIDALIKKSKKTIIVSCWNESEFVSPFPANCHFIKLVGQEKVRRSHERGYHLVDEFDAVLEELLGLAGDCCLVLLGGGILAKPLAVESAKIGAVAIDVGSTLDYWAAHYTRNPAEPIE